MSIESNQPLLLLRIAEDRDREAFAELFHLYAPKIGGLLASRGLPASARDEVVQEVMLRVWRKAHQYDPERAAVSTWIFALARNAHIDRVRKGRPIVDESDPTFVEDPTPSPATRAMRSQEGARVRDAVAGLPEAQSAVLRAAYFEYKSLAQIATEFDVPLGTIKSRVRLAFRALRRTLGEAP